MDTRRPSAEGKRGRPEASKPSAAFKGASPLWRDKQTITQNPLGRSQSAARYKMCSWLDANQRGPAGAADGGGGGAAGARLRGGARVQIGYGFIDWTTASPCVLHVCF